MEKSQEELDEFVKNCKEIEEMLARKNKDPWVIRNRQLFKIWLYAVSIEKEARRGAVCPNCEGDWHNIKFACCDLTLRDATELAKKNLKEWEKKKTKP